MLTKKLIISTNFASRKPVALPVRGNVEGELNNLETILLAYIIKNTRVMNQKKYINYLNSVVVSVFICAMFCGCKIFNNTRTDRVNNSKIYYYVFDSLAKNIQESVNYEKKHNGYDVYGIIISKATTFNKPEQKISEYIYYFYLVFSYDESIHNTLYEFKRLVQIMKKSNRMLVIGDHAYPVYFRDADGIMAISENDKNNKDTTYDRMNRSFAYCISSGYLVDLAEKKILDVY